MALAIVNNITYNSSLVQSIKIQLFILNILVVMWEFEEYFFVEPMAAVLQDQTI